MMNFQRLSVPGLDVFHCTGVLGDSYELTPVGVVSPETYPYLTLHYEGQVFQVCSNSPKQRLIGNGDSSADGLLFEPGCGTITRTITTPTYSYFCLSDVSKRKLPATAIRLTVGQSFSVPVGCLLFIGTGQAQVLTQTLTAPSYVEAAVAESYVTALTDVIALCITQLPPLP